MLNDFLSQNYIAWKFLTPNTSPQIQIFYPFLEAATGGVPQGLQLY